LKYLLDTNIISELIAKNPNSGVVSFVKSLDEELIFLSVITIGEIKLGIENIDDSSVKKEFLRNWFYHDLMNRFKNKIVDIDSDIIFSWAKISNKLKKCGKPMPIMDSLIASTCLAKNFILITRNIKDFENIEIEVVNPFLSETKKN